MSYVGQIVDIFVSSPGDVSEHRDSILMIVQSWNQRNGRTKKLFFNCLRWEDFVAADVGESGQDVIYDQLGEDYDIFLGVMWARFGSPTLNADSGTEDEFDRAIERHRSGEPIRVSFLFCTADVPLASLDGVQFAKVQEFKKKAHLKGCLTRDFIDDASLINSINLILDRFANTWGNTIPIVDELDDSAPKDGANSTATDTQPSKSSVSKEDYEDIGMLDVLDDFLTHNSMFVDAIGRWANRLGIVQEQNQIATSRLTDISKFGKPETHQVREIVGKLAKEMDHFANWCENEIIDLENVMELLSRDSLLIIDLSRDFEESSEDIESARNSLKELHDSINDANQGILDYVGAVERSPKLDKKLNKANRRVVMVHRRLAEKNRIFQQDMALCIADLNDQLEEKSGS